MKKMRFLVIGALSLFVIFWYLITDPNGGNETLARLQWLAWIMVVSGPVYLLRRAFFDNARSCEAYKKAMESSVGAGLVFLGLCILTGLIFISFAGRANATELPKNAIKYIDILKEEQNKYWRDIPIRSTLAAQVEQETCYSLKSKKCWNPNSELKTSREYGFGLGQITITPSFNNFNEARKLDITLRNWEFSNRYDPRMQLRSMVLMDRNLYIKLIGMVNDKTESLAMSFSAYNGGLSGVLQDRRLCSSIKGCDPSKWFNHVELHSLKSKNKKHGYGLSFYEINRDYVRNVMYLRRYKYKSIMGDLI